MPDGEVDSCCLDTDAILSTTSDSALKLFEKRDDTCVLYFATSDFSVDPPDATSVDTNTSPLCDILTNGHVRTKNTIQGVVNINQNARRKLPNGCSDSAHDRCWDVDFVF